MKKFSILLAKLAAIFIGLNLLSIPLFLQSGNSRFLRYVKPFLKVSNHYNLVVLGDSHADDVWRTNTSPEILNAAAGSDNQTDIARKIAHLQKRGVKIDRVLYEIDRSQFTTSRERHNNNDISGCMATDAPMWLVYSLPLVFNPKIKVELQSALSDLFRKKPNSTATAHQIDTTEMQKRATEQFFNAKLSDSMFRVMKKNIRTLRESGIEVVLISYPLYNGYVELIDSSKTFQQSMHAAQPFITSSQLQELNYLNALCQKDHFANQDHVYVSFSQKLRLHILHTISTGKSANVRCAD